mmetsp:Transcript_5213/g.18757  ORF Transcript_5213/g.18757 Transcript_5213/m.18757 type:complete len:282 (-) Transcript_5213:3143-3988(-)
MTDWLTGTAAPTAAAASTTTPLMKSISVDAPRFTSASMDDVLCRVRRATSSTKPRSGTSAPNAADEAGSSTSRPSARRSGLDRPSAAACTSPCKRDSSARGLPASATSPLVMPNSAVSGLMHAFTVSLCTHTAAISDAGATLAGRPVASSSIATSRAAGASASMGATMVVGPSPACSTLPGPSIVAACAVEPNSTRRSPSTPRSVSIGPMPFCSVTTTPSADTTSAASSAAGAVWPPLTSTSTTSARHASASTAPPAPPRPYAAGDMIATRATAGEPPPMA